MPTVPTPPAQPPPTRHPSRPAAGPSPLTTLAHPAAGETTLFLVRHGRTAANRLRLLQGVSDVPLEPTGLRQAARVADRLGGEPAIDAVLSSPLDRALATARLIGDRLGHEPVVLPGLIEMDFGRYEGVSYERLVMEEPELAERFLDLSDFDVAWPGGDTRGRFYERVWATFGAILHDYAAHRVVVVAHGGVFGAFLAMLEGRSPNDLSVYDLHNCSLTHLHVSANHTVIHRRNEIGHLDGCEEDAEEPATPAAERQR